MIVGVSVPQPPRRPSPVCWSLTARRKLWRFSLFSTTTRSGYPVSQTHNQQCSLVIVTPGSSIIKGCILLWLWLQTHAFCLWEIWKPNVGAKHLIELPCFPACVTLHLLCVVNAVRERLQLYKQSVVCQIWKTQNRYWDTSLQDAQRASLCYVWEFHKIWSLHSILCSCTGCMIIQVLSLHWPPVAACLTLVSTF